MEFARPVIGSHSTITEQNLGSFFAGSKRDGMLVRNRDSACSF